MGARRRSGSDQQEPHNELSAMFGASAVQMVDGVVVESSRQDGSGTGASEGRLFLKLVDGSRAFGCADCAFTSRGRREMTLHRHEEHGGVLRAPERDESVSAPPDDAADRLDMMTVRELIDLAAEFEQWAAAHDKMREQVAYWKERAETAERELRKWERTMGRLGFQKVPDEE